MYIKFLTWLCLLIAITVAAVGLWFEFNVLIIESKDTAQSAPPDTKFVTINRETLAYSEVDNNAPQTVVFVGGLSAWHGTWQRTIDVLKQNEAYNYVALDLPPFGYSIVPAQADYSRKAQASRISAFISELVDRRDLDRVILVAHSYGAGPAAEAVLTQKDPVIGKFIIIDGVLNIDEARQPSSAVAGNDMLRTVVTGIVIHIRPLLLSRMQGFVAVHDHVNADLLALYTRSFNTRGTTQKLSRWIGAYLSDPLEVASTNSESYKKITIPVRVIWGNEDSLTPFSLSDVLVYSVPDVKRYSLHGVGHIPMIEDYEQFDAALKKALTE